MASKKEVVHYHLLPRLITFISLLTLGLILHVRPIWLLGSFAVLFPTQFTFPVLVIFLLRSLQSPPWIIDKQLYSIIIIAICFLLDRLSASLSFSIAIIFLFQCILGVMFKTVGRIIDPDNAALVVYGFLTIGAAGLITNNLSNTPEQSIKQFLSLIPAYYRRLWFLASRFLDEKKHNQLIRLLPSKIKKMLRFWPQIVDTAYRMVLFISLVIIIRKLILTEMGRLHFFQYYFPSQQFKEYIWRTGKYDIPILVLIFVAIGQVLLSKKISLKIPTIFSTYFVGIYLTGTMYNATTANIREKVYIWSVTPQTVSEVWTDVTVRGANFKEKPFDAFVYVNGVPHRVISWNDKEVVFRTDPTFTKSGKILLINSSKDRSNEVDFVYYPPK